MKEENKTKIYLAKLNKKIKSDDYIKYILFKFYGYDFYDIKIARPYKNGKPYIINSNIKYSVSHKKNYIIAIISNQEVGIDLEINDNLFRTKIVDKFFCENEKNYIYKENCKDRIIKFYEIWTKKEAYIKKNSLNLSYIKKIDTIKQSIFTFNDENIIISICMDNY